MPICRHLSLVLVLLLSLLVLSACGPSDAAHPAQTGAPAASSSLLEPRPPARIVSMAPSTTEILFALGLGDRVVGVSRFCDYPPEVEDLPKAGGFADPNYEQIVALEPDVVVLVTSHEEVEDELERLGVAALVTPHKTIEGIHEAIRLIAGRCGAEAAANGLLAGFEARTKAIQQAVQGRPRPRLMICIGRDRSSGELSGMYMAGHDGFYDAITQLAGGVCALNDSAAAFPQLSAEGVIQVNPEVVVDLTADPLPTEDAKQRLVEQWNALHAVTAVRTGRVYIVSGNHALRPGPRYIEFLEELARLLHPEAFAARPSG